MLRFIGTTVGLTSLYVVGLIAIVAMSIWYLFIDYAGRDWIAFWIVMPFAWALGFWPTVLPVLSAIKVRRLMRTMDSLGDQIDPSAQTATSQAKQELLDSLDFPVDSIEDIDLAIEAAEDEKADLLKELADLQDGPAEEGGEGEAIDFEGEAAALGDDIAAIDEEIAALNEARANAEAYEQAASDVEQLEADLAEQELAQRESLEAAANKEVTDEIEIAVQTLLGIYMEPPAPVETTHPEDAEVVE